MIFSSILSAISVVLGFVFGWLPVVNQLPLGMDDALTTAFGWFFAIKEIIPPLDIIWTAFIWYMGFRFTLFLLRLFRIIPS